MSAVKVQVWGRTYTVEVHNELKTKWVASGTYEGTIITVSDSSRGSAIIRWREAATYRGNG